MPVDPELLSLLRDDPDRASLWLADRSLSPRAKPAVRRGFLAAGIGRAATPPEVARADFEIVRATDLHPRLAQIACPIVWLDGADDAMVPDSCREGRPGSVVSVPETGHLIPIEAAAALAEVILDHGRAAGAAA